jgi:uncharacterized protein (TIGR02099 family)
MIHHVKKATRYLLFWSLIVGAMGSVLLRLLLSSVEYYKADLEQQFYQLTEISMQIGTLKADTRGFNPQIILRDIDILSVDESGRPAIELDEVRVGIDIAQLLFNWDVLSSSWLTLVGVKVGVSRNEDGSITINGLNSGGDQQPTWLARAGKYELLNSEVTWRDGMHHGNPIVMQNLSLLIKNQQQGHEVHLITNLAERYGGSMRISAKIIGNALAAEATSGEIYFEGNELKYAELISAELPLKIQVDNGVGDLKLWGAWSENQMQWLAGKVKNKDLWLKRDKDKALLLDELSGEFSWSQNDSGQAIAVSDLSIQVRGELPAKPASVSLFAGSDHHLTAMVEQLDLAPVSDVVPFFLTQEQSEHIPAQLKVGGLLNESAVYISADRSQWAVNGTMKNLVFSSATDLPQMESVSGRILGTHAQGAVALSSLNGAIYFPDLFRSPIVFDRIAGTLNWQDNEQGMVITSDYLAIDNNDWSGYANFFMHIPQAENAEAPFLSIQLAFDSVAEVTQVANYLPAKIMGKDAVAWLDQAFLGGYVRNGTMLLSGNPQEFPFVDGQGKFEVLFEAEQGVLSFHPDWPQLTQLKASAHFFGDSLRVKVHQAKTEGVTVSGAVVDMPVLSDARFLLIEGVANAEIRDGLGFMQQTPLHGVVDGVVAATDILGRANVDLKLKVPLEESIVEKVEGIVHLKDAQLNVTAIDLPIDKIRGQLRFTEQGVFSERLSGQLLGFPVTASITTQQQATQIKVSGRTDMSHLQQQFSFLQNNFCTGETAYISEIRLPSNVGQVPTVTINSSLRGMAINLPGTLKKHAIQNKLLALRMYLPEGPILPLDLQYDNQLKLALQIDKQNQALHSGHIVYGKGDASAVKKTGVHLDVNLAELDIAAWIDFLQPPKTSKQVGGLPGIDVISFNLGELQWRQQHLGSLQLAIRRLDDFWQGSINTPVAQGAIKIPVGLVAGKTLSMQMVHLDLSRLMQLDLPESTESERQFPMLAIQSEKLLWNDADLGRLELKTRQVPGGLHFEPLTVIGPYSEIKMTADWLSQEGGTQTRVEGRLQSYDFGRFLGRLGFNEDLKETEADIRFNLRWDGAPDNYSLDKVEGPMQVRLKDGRIASIEPGLGRLLGLIAMEQWVKRFTLDFTDVYKKGLAFNNIAGTFDISDGKALTDDLLLDAIAVRAKIIGEANLVDKTLDNRVLVVPKSTAAVPIAGTIVDGIASVITRVFTDDYKEGYFFGSEYRVTGKWSDAEVIPVNDRDGVLKKTWDQVTDFPWAKP